jgi:hypothetical protein
MIIKINHYNLFHQKIKILINYLINKNYIINLKKMEKMKISFFDEELYEKKTIKEVP